MYKSHAWPLFILAVLVLPLVAVAWPNSAAATIEVDSATCGTTIPGSWTSFPEYECYLNENYTVTSGSTLEIPSGIILETAGYGITVDSGGIVTVDSLGNLYADSTQNNGTINVAGVLYVGGPQAFTNGNGGALTIEDDGRLFLYGGASNQVGGVIYIYGDAANAGSVSNAGNFYEECGNGYSVSGGSFTGNAPIVVSCPSTVTQTQAVTDTTTSISTTTSTTTQISILTQSASTTTTTTTSTLPASTTTTTLIQPPSTSTVTSTVNDTTISVSTTTESPVVSTVTLQGANTTIAGPTTTVTSTLATPGPTTTNSTTVTQTSPPSTVTQTQTGPTVTAVSTRTVTSTVTAATTQTHTSPTTTHTTTQTTQTSTKTTTALPPSLTIQSVNQNGQIIVGYWTVLRSSIGLSLSTGYTPKTFTGLTAVTTYGVELDSYGNCQFSHWEDTGFSVDPRIFTANGAQTFVGVYDCSGAAPRALPMHAGTGGDLATLMTILDVVISSAVAVATLFVFKRHGMQTA